MVINFYIHPADKSVMAMTLDWMPHFKISQEELAQWQQQAPPSADILHWALLHQKIDQQEFLRFASDELKIPSLKAEFFSEAIAGETWQKYSQKADWKSNFLPLGEWDGILYVGFSGAAPINLSLPHCLVVAPAEHLENLWKDFNGREDITQPVFTSAHIKTEVERPRANSAEESSWKSAPNFERPELKSESDEAATPEIEAPAGLTIEDRAALEVDTESPDGLTVSVVVREENAGDPSKASEENEASVDHGSIQMLDEEIASKTLAGVKFDSLLATQTPSAPVTEPKQTTATPPPMSPPRAMTPPPLPSKTPPPLPPLPDINLKEESELTITRSFKIDVTKELLSETPSSVSTAIPTAAPSMPAPPVQRMQPPPLPKRPPAPTSIPNLVTEGTLSQIVPPPLPKRTDQSPPPIQKNDKPVEAATKSTIELVESEVAERTNPNIQMATRFEQATTYEQCADVAFQMMQGTFDRGMLLVMQNGSLRPWKWTKNLFTAHDKQDAIDLSKPSMFKIVSSTGQPFHGHIVNVPVNVKFFEDFNRSIIPTHGTLVPILVKGQVVAMLLGLTDQDINFRNSLAFTERIVEQLGEAMARIRGKKAA